MFQALAVGGPFEVTVEVGPQPHLEITGDENVVPKVQSKVRGTTLHLELPGRVMATMPLVVSITMPTLEELDVTGTSSVRVTGLSGDELEVDVSGTSTVTLEGTLESVEIEASGASTVESKQLTAAHADLNISGASNAEIRVTEALKAQASGASSIRYYGRPTQRSTNPSGSATIEAAD